MDWQQVTQSFLPLSREQTTPFAPPRELDLAIATYNRAIRNLNQDSADIALIALRKLASDYPQFHEASLLYGCCLAQAGLLEEARQQLLCTQQLPGLPSDLAEATEAALKLLDNDLAAAASQTGPRPGARPGPGPRTIYTDPLAEQIAAADLQPGTGPVVLERTGRRKKMRMASERERREVMRQGEMPRQEETHVVMPRTTVEIVRSVLPVALIVLAAALVVFLGIRFLPGFFNQISGNAETQERLSYLLAQLEQKAPQNPELQSLLTDYSNRFTPTSPTAATTPATLPTTAATSAPAAVTTASQPAVIPTATAAPTQPAATTAAPTLPSETVPTPVAPTATPAMPTSSASQPADAVTALQSANALVLDGMAAKSTDIVRAAEQFRQAVQLLAPIPPQTTAAGVGQTAGTLRTQAQSELDALARNAALRLRSDAQALFDRDQYAAALPLYLRAYALHPESYGGGVAYYCGRCYQLLGQPDQARPYYQFVIQTFAGRDIATSAAARLREIGG